MQNPHVMIWFVWFLSVVSTWQCGQNRTMTFFKRKKATTSERQSSRETLIGRIVQAEAAVETARREAVTAVLNGANVAAQTAADGKAHLAEVSLSVLRAALVELDREIAQAEAAEAEKLAQAKRDESVAALEDLAVQWEEAVAPLPAVLEALGEVASIHQSIFGPSGLAALLANLAKELPIAAQMAAADLRARANAIAAGTARPEMPHRPELFVIDGTLAPLERVDLKSKPKTYEIPEGQRPQLYIPERPTANSYGARPCNDPPITSKSWPAGSGPDEGF
jgi:hypothetical protein